MLIFVAHLGAPIPPRVIVIAGILALEAQDIVAIMW